MNTTKKTMSLLPGFNMATTNMIAQYLSADVQSIRRIGARLWDQMTTMGAIRATKEDFINHGYMAEKIGGGYHCKRDGFDIIVPHSTSYAILYPMECVELIESVLTNHKPRASRTLKCFKSHADDKKDIAVTEIQQPAIESSRCDIKVFSNDTFGSIRTIMRDNDPWFVAADVCRALEINNNRDAISRLDDDEKKTVALTDGNRGNPNTTIINEPGLYSLVLGSRKPEAKAFKRWITHDVIPSIRKNGAYIMGQETLSETELIAKALIACNKIVEDQKIQIAKLKCKNDILLANAQAWEYPSIINAFMRKYACACCAGSFESAWSELYRNLQYKHHINLKIRKAKPNTSYMKRALPDELPIIAQTALAMCESAGLDAGAIINEVNIAALTS